MKIRWKGFLAKNHSWSIVGQNISRQLYLMGHQVDLFSTNGLEHFPEDLKPMMKAWVDEKSPPEIIAREEKKLDSNYEMQLSYTAFKNYPSYFNSGSKNKFGIWTYEFAGKNSLPKGFAKNYKYCDLILPPSQFAKKVFLDSGVPESHMAVIPHGINVEEINSAEPFKLKTKKSFKIFVNIAQVHKRKNLSGLLEMYGKAFSQKDDVCLVIKVNDKVPSLPFEQKFGDLIADFKNKYKLHADVEVVKEFVPNIYSLYKSCDAIFSASHCEAFGMTALEGQAVGLINLAPRYGGFLDFMNDNNSLLIEGKEFYVKPDMVYWSYQPGSIAFMPSTDSGVEKLRYAYQNQMELKVKAQALIPEVIDLYSWKNVTQKILGLVK